MIAVIKLYERKLIRSKSTGKKRRIELNIQRYKAGVS